MNVSRLKRIDKKLPIIDYSKTVKIDIGCGDVQVRKDAGFLGLDIYDFGQEIIWDIEEGLPFPDNSIDEIYTAHTLEHLDNVDATMNEMHRILKPGGKTHIIVPHKDHTGAYVLTHKTFFNEHTFEYMERDLYRYGFKRWKLNSIVTNERKDIHANLTPVKL